MNILIPDSWLRTFLKTKATPLQIKEYLSLCGPSVERINEDSGLPAQAGEPVYDIEITTNRPDAMSVLGVAREASVILPRFGIAATLLDDPYKDNRKMPSSRTSRFPLYISTDPVLNPRWTSVVMSGVKVQKSPKWLVDWLTKTGIRPINTIIDITNYLMRAYGQPAHAFDYDAIAKHIMKLRVSKKGEKLTTLDGKTHILPGSDIVIEDGSGSLIDLCGIMGGENSSIKDSTTNVILFLQTYEPVHIRKTSMKLAHRTEAAGLFEKGIDTQLVMPTFLKGIELMEKIAGGTQNQIQDIYLHPYKPYQAVVSRKKTDAYIGSSIPDKEIVSILTSLGFKPTITQQEITVTVPSWRRDVTIDVDIIEEIARIYGYHRIVNKLPEGEPPMTIPDPALTWEEEVKIRLRDWGYTELYTYSMISQQQMKDFHLDTREAYKITNPLSEDWLYMRPSLEPGFLLACKENLKHKTNLRVFELSMVYHYQKNSLPREESTLIVGLSANRFFEAKGLGEALVKLFGIEESLEKYGTVQNRESISLLTLSITKLVRDAKSNKKYIPIPKYPPMVEDISFIVPEKFAVGPFITAMKNAHPLVTSISLLDVYESTRTLHVTYQDPGKNLTTEEIEPVRKTIIALAKEKFGVTLKTI